jgi:hypothetical protein
VLYGHPSEAQPVELSGKLVLTNPESMAVRGIKVNLSGMRKVSYVYHYFQAKLCRGNEANACCVT